MLTKWKKTLHSTKATDDMSNGTFQSSLLPQDESRVPHHFVWNSHFSSIICHLCVRARMHVFCLLQIRFLAEPLNA
jgi:hypothetical protein